MSVTLISAPANQRQTLIGQLLREGKQLADVLWLTVNLELPESTFSLRYHDGRHPGLQTVLLGLDGFRHLARYVHKCIFWQAEEKQHEFVICISCNHGKPHDWS